MKRRPVLGEIETLRLAPGDALFLDFDGVLAEIGPDPDAVFMPPRTQAALERLSVRLDGAIALLSGRDLRDLARRSPGAVWRAGGHGLEVAAPGAELPPPPAPPSEAILSPLRDAVDSSPGVRLELKGPVAALHYRANPDAGAACIAAAELAAAAEDGLVVQAGKMVVEVKPDRAHKGRTLRLMSTLPPFAGRRPVMFGDDTTDEDAFRAAQELGGVGVKVGPGDTAAILRTPDPDAVRAWIDRESLSG